MSDTVQAHIFYSGTVQGVGFRYAVHRYASGLGLKGWVKNVPDGRVEILLEGEENKIRGLCERIDEHFDGYIRNKEIAMRPSRAALRDFRIVYG
jgi:acylphosphatase